MAAAHMATKAWWQDGLLDLLLCLLIVCAALFLPLLAWGLGPQVAVGAGALLLSSYLFVTNRRLFVPTLFFAIHALLSPDVAEACEVVAPGYSVEGNRAGHGGSCPWERPGSDRLDKRKPS